MGYVYIDFGRRTVKGFKRGVRGFRGCRKRLLWALYEVSLGGDVLSLYLVCVVL